MTRPSRERLATLVRRRDCDLAEAALLCCLEVEPDTDVDVELLRLDAIADGVRTGGFEATSATAAAAGLADHLAGRLGFGASPRSDDPGDALLTRVLDRRRGRPVALAIVYVAIARRLGLAAYGVRLPGQYLVAIDTGGHPIVLDPARDGLVLDEAALQDRVHEATRGRVAFRRSMVRPAAPATVIRSLLDALTHAFVAGGDAADALWTVEVKQVLPGAPADDHRVRGELLVDLGRFLEAAVAYEAYLATAPGAEDAEAVRRAAIRARAKLN